MRKGAGRDDSEGCMVQESKIYLAIPRISYVARNSSDLRSSTSLLAVGSNIWAHLSNVGSDHMFMCSGI